MRLKQPTFKIILFESKELTDGTHPVMIRATFNRERKYYSVGVSVRRDQWNDELARIDVRRLNEEQRQANHTLAAHERQLKDTAVYFKDVEFTFDRFERRFFNTAGTKVYPFIEQVIEDLKQQQRLSSAESYKNCLSRLRSFRPKGITWHDVDTKFLQQFEQHLRPNSTSTIGIYMRVLRALFNRAISEGIVRGDIYPFRNYTIKTEASRKRALTKEQIDALKTYKSKRGSREWDSLNMFLFSYYARGMNFRDMMLLKRANIRNGRIYYRREKTGDNIDLAIDANIAAILANYTESEYIFPLLEDNLPATTIRHRCKGRLKKCNKDLETIAKAINAKATNESKKLSLPGDITFYWARHSYATALKRAGVGISVIQETLGHSSEAVTRHYLDSFETNQLDEISRYL